MRIMLLYPHPPEPDGQSLQGVYLRKGLKENGHEVVVCDRADNIQKEWAYRSFKPDVAIGIGYWADTPDLILDPLEHGVAAVPWFNADGWIANYHQILNSLPLLMVTSTWVKSTYIRDGVSGENIQVAHIGFDPSVFYPRSDSAVHDLRRTLGIEDDEKMILTIGGDATSKGAQEMFRALTLINPHFQKWKYVCKVWNSFSARNHGKEERRLIRELGLDINKIIYLEGKYSPEFMALLLNACDIYTAPSRLEGFGMIQVEAQACGKPVISINAGGPRDTIIHEKTGFLANVASEIKLEREWAYPWMGFEEKRQIEFPEPKTFAYRADTNQLAMYTRRLLENDHLREQMGKAAAAHASEQFHYVKRTQHIVDLIKSSMLKKERVEAVQLSHKTSDSNII